MKFILFMPEMSMDLFIGSSQKAWKIESGEWGFVGRTLVILISDFIYK
jgi:hypothetical protein